MNTLKGRRVIIVGGAGFIGHHLAVQLRVLGAEVTVIDNLMINNYYHYLENKHVLNAERYLEFTKCRIELLREYEIPLIEVDARDYHLMCKTINETPGDVLIHLAAVAHANKSNKDPYSTFDHSLRTLENSLDVSRSPNNEVKHFIYFSSSMVYGNFVTESVAEDATCEPIGIYGTLKYCGEQLVKAYHQVFGMPYTIVRPSALYGERCVSRRVAQIFIENALHGEEVIVHGDGSDRLDFTYIEDLCQGVTKVITNDKAKCEVFNVTYGESRSISDVITVLEGQLSNLKVSFKPKDRLVPSRGTLSVDKARNLLGYAPSHPIEKGLVKYLEWYRSSCSDLNEGL